MESIKQRIESNQRRDGNSEESMTHAELVTMADEMLDIVSQEGLERDLADYHRMLMAAFANLFKDFAGATKHGREALEIERQMGDTESLFYKELVEDLRVLEQAQEFAEWLNTD